MSVKDNLLTAFEQNRGAFISGEALAAELNVTRAAVWKAIAGLKKDGYLIEGVPNKGYRLSADTDVLSSAGTEKYLNAEYGILPEVFGTVGSTNDIVKQKAAEGVPEGYTAIASNQTAGRGRRGRSFYSPEGSGLYMSVLLRPSFDLKTSALLTTAAACAVAVAAERVSGRKTDIKWVNDCLIDGRKICGILTEASTSLENGTLDYAVVGIGINIKEPQDGFPEELKEIAGSVFGKEAPPDAKNRLAAEVLNELFGYYRSLEKRQFLSEYRKRLFFLGKNVNIISAGSTRFAKALSVDDDCHLRVRFEDDTESALSSGEISIRPI